MIKVGTDIVEIKRVKAALNKFDNRFLERFLNPSEIQLASKLETIAGFWAAKEAIAKAIGTGIGKELNFKDITIYKNHNNSPYFKLNTKNFSIIDSSISIAHEKEFAIAVAIVIIKDNSIKSN